MSEKNRKPIARLTLVTTAKDELDVKARVQQTIKSTLRWTFIDGSDLPGSVTLETNHRHDRFSTECQAVAAIAKAQGFKK